MTVTMPSRWRRHYRNPVVFGRPFGAATRILRWVAHILRYSDIDKVGSSDGVQSVIEAGICPCLVELLFHSSPSVLIAALKTIRNILDASDAQTQLVIDGKVLPRLLQLLVQNEIKNIKKKACTVTSKRAAQIQAVIDANIINPLIQLMQHPEFDLRKEAALAITNATFGASSKQIHYLVNQGCIKPLCDLLGCKEPTTVRICLDGLDNIMNVGRKCSQTSGVNPYVKLTEDCGGLDKIENLIDEREQSELHQEGSDAGDVLAGKR